MADHGKAERRPQVRILDEDLGAVGTTVAVCIRENDDAIAGRVGEWLGFRGVEPAVVHRFGDPDASAGVDVDVGRVEEHRRLGPELDLEIVGQEEPIANLLFGLPRGCRDQGEQQQEQATTRRHG